jgi:hypothetical protein
LAGPSGKQRSDYAASGVIGTTDSHYLSALTLGKELAYVFDEWGPARGLTQPLDAKEYA